jgi:hypothetical protein
VNTGHWSYPHKWILIGLQVAFAVGLVFFWTEFFGGGSNRVSHDAFYVMFESQFVAADIVTGIAGLVCAAGLWRDAQWAQVWGGVFAGGLLFLGCMDVSYNLYAGNYARLGPAMLVENVINVYCFVFGPYLIYYLVRHRHVGTHA